ncbi:unnamed protein product [Ixodes persulcatus]
MELGLTAEEARQLESNTRQQSLSEQWHSAREHRLTASSFGAVNKREQWTEKGLKNLFKPRDLSHVRVIEYGRKNEPVAADRYASVLKSAGHVVSLQHSGLVINPSCPWLGASPDRFVYDPEERSYGTLEIKCQYSL